MANTKRVNYTYSPYKELATLRAEFTAIGGVCTSFESLPLEIELQAFRRALDKPEYIEQEKRERPAWLNERLVRESRKQWPSSGVSSAMK